MTEEEAKEIANEIVAFTDDDRGGSGVGVRDFITHKLVGVPAERPQSWLEKNGCLHTSMAQVLAGRKIS